MFEVGVGGGGFLVAVSNIWERVTWKPLGCYIVEVSVVKSITNYA